MGVYAMMFPDTVEEFMEEYKMVDREHIYSNGCEYVPIYRMKQWFAHKPQIDLVRCGECKWWNRDDKRKDGKGWCENVICGLTKLNAFCSYGERRADEHNT